MQVFAHACRSSLYHSVSEVSLHASFSSAHLNSGSSGKPTSTHAGVEAVDGGGGAVLPPPPVPPTMIGVGGGGAVEAPPQTPHVFAHAWRSGGMVQAVGELHAAELACEYAARRVDLHGSLLLELLDARSALGALAKGRSSAWPFLRILRRVTAMSIATEIEFCPRWISSEEQPADAASRWFQRGPRCDWKRGKRMGEADRPGPPRRRPLRGKRLAVGTLVA